MLGDGIFHNLTVLCHCVKFNLVGLGHELRDNHWVFLTYLACHLQEALKLLVVVAYVHGGTGQHVRWTNQYGETNPVYKRLHIVHACQRTPLWLVDAQLVEHSRELVAVFSPVYAHG